MANNYKVGVEITADSKDANKNIQQAEVALDNLDSAAKKADKSTNSLSKQMDSFGKGLQQFGQDFSKYVTLPIAGFAALAVNEFIDAEKELSALNIALQNSGNYSRGAVENFQALADELERTTNFSGGAVTMASSLALGFTKTTEEAERLVRAAADLSAATGMDLESSVTALGQSLQGVSGSLARTLPQMRNLTEEQLRAGVAIDYVENRFSGSALQATKNLSGEITRLKNGFLAFASDIGSQLAPYLRVLVSSLNDALEYVRNLDPVVRNTAIGVALFAAAIGPVAVAVGGFISILPTLVAGLSALGSAFLSVARFILGPVGLVVGLAGTIKLFYDLWKVTDDVGQALFLTWQFVGAQFYKYFVDPFLWGFQQIYSVLSNLPGAVGRAFADSEKYVIGLRESLAQNTTAMTEEVDKVFEGTGQSAANSFTFGLSDGLKNLKQSIQDSFTLPVVDGFKAVNAAQEEFNKETKKKSEEQNQYAQTIAGSFTNAFSSIADGTKSVSESFADMANSIISDLTRMILQQSIYNALSGFFGGGTATTTQAATGGFVNNGQLTHRYAQGGMVRGPGTGTSDSIPARLSNGEFVSDAKTVSHFGPDFFLNLKHMARSFSMPSPILNRVPAFANGGLVGGAGSGETRVVIQNSGSPKEASSVTTEQDAQGMVVNIILEDIQRNGSIAKSMQGNYGLKRSSI